LFEKLAPTDNDPKNFYTGIIVGSYIPRNNEERDLKERNKRRTGQILIGYSGILVYLLKP